MTTLEDWVGIPFSWQGALPGTHDCWTLAKAYLAEHGLVLPDYEYIPHEHAETIATATSQPQWVPVTGEPQPLDVVLLGHNERLHHVGVIVEPDMLLHMTPRTGSIVQRLSLITQVSPYRQWQAYRWVG